jgi:hypothetical protein
LPVRKHLANDARCGSPRGWPISEAGNEAVPPVEVGWAVGAARIGLVVAEKIEIERIDAPGAARVIESF